jgi:hypothetical protein
LEHLHTIGEGTQTAPLIAHLPSRHKGKSPIIKAANVFLHEGDGAKLGDMNVSKISEEGLCVTQTGTPYYASP